MSALTLLLVVGLCSNGPDPICTYLDVTKHLEVTSDAGCYQRAIIANEHNIDTGQAPRYNCVSQERFLTLMGEKAKAEAPEPGKVL